MPLQTSPYWKGEVFTLFANHPDAERASSAQIARLVEDIARERAPSEERDRYPSDRTIRGTLRDEYAALSEDAKASFRMVRWPETFDAGVLPWSVAPAALRLLRDEGRISVRRARWYHRLSTAAPGIPEWVADGLSRRLAASEAAGMLGEHDLRSVELFLAYEAWYDTGRSTYLERLDQLREKHPPAYEIGFGEIVGQKIPMGDREAMLAIATEFAGPESAQTLVGMWMEMQRLRRFGEEENPDVG